MRAPAVLAWKRLPGGDWAADDGLPGHNYAAVLRYKPALDGWVAHVFTDGALIHLSEHPSRDLAARAAEAAVKGANALRGLP